MDFHYINLSKLKKKEDCRSLSGFKCIGDGLLALSKEWELGIHSLLERIPKHGSDLDFKSLNMPHLFTQALKNAPLLLQSLNRATFLCVCKTALKKCHRFTKIHNSVYGFWLNIIKHGYGLGMLLPHNPVRAQSNPLPPPPG